MLCNIKFLVIIFIHVSDKERRKKGEEERQSSERQQLYYLLFRQEEQKLFVYDRHMPEIPPEEQAEYRLFTCFWRDHS